MLINSIRAAAFALATAAAPALAQASDTITFALAGGGSSWDFSVIDFGTRAGFFSEAGIDIEVAATDNTAAAIQALIAGNVEMANAGFTQFIAARLEGAPVKMISSSFVGASDWMWYVRTESPIRSFADITETNTVGVNSFGSSQYIVLRAMLDQYGVAPEVIAAGSNTAVLSQVMIDQIDVGTDGNGLLGVPQAQNGEVRPIAYGSDIEEMRQVSVRGLLVSETALAARPDVFKRFLQAYDRTVQWMYDDPQALAWYAEKTGTSVEEVSALIEHHYPPGAMRVGEVSGVDVTVSQGLAFERIAPGG
jgi:NitT/TauT family transport system substrate-binding protein